MPVSPDELAMVPRKQRSQLMQEVHATAQGMTVKKFENNMKKRRAAPGMFGGKKITPEHILEKIKDLWFLKEKAAFMDELELTDDEIIVIIKKVSEEFGFSYEKIQGALINSRHISRKHMNPEDVRIRNILWKPILKECFLPEIDPLLFKKDDPNNPNVIALNKSYVTAPKSYKK